MIVSSTTGTPCLGTFLGAIFAAGFRDRFFGVARFATFLRAGLALAFRFEVFLRATIRFFALAMAVSCEICRRHAYRSDPTILTLSLSDLLRQFYHASPG
jgi:hypothetical protein